MSCAAFTILGAGFLVFNANNRIALYVTFAAAIVMLLIASYLAWRGEYRSRLEAEKAIYDGRPLFTLEIVQQPSWQTQNPKDAIFRLTNCGKRAARYVRLDSQKSTLRGHTMEFVQLPLLSPDNSEMLAYAIDQHGADQRALCEFLQNNPEDSALVWWDIKVNFRDTNDAQAEDLIRLCYDVQSKALYTTGVPYTERGKQE